MQSSAFNVTTAMAGKGEKRIQSEVHCYMKDTNAEKSKRDGASSPERKKKKEFSLINFYNLINERSDRIEARCLKMLCSSKICGVKWNAFTTKLAVFALKWMISNRNMRLMNQKLCLKFEVRRTAV